MSNPDGQGWRTPPEFLSAVRERFGEIVFDLAATPGHEVAPAYYSPEQNSLNQDWINLPGPVVFLNPPFANIRPWARKLSECRELRRWTLMLVPASMGSLWWATYVLHQCYAFGIPRIKFVGAESLYPKDLALICAGYGVSGASYWDWRKKQ